MDLSGFSLVLLIAALMTAATPILFAALGELVVERAGVLNLGVEGMMITGAVCGFVVTIETGQPFLGYIAGAAGGALLALLFAFLTQITLANQVAAGLALTLFGLGLSSLIGQDYVGLAPARTPDLFGPALRELPVVGPILFGHDPILYLGLALVPAVWAFLTFSRAGLVLRSVGENHTAAHALGYKVVRIRTLAILFGGACAGVGGAYLSLVRVPQWTEGMTAGIGWIALALVVFASWKPGRVLLGAYLFGGLDQLQLRLQGAGVAFPVEYLAMSPYIMTIVVLVFLSADRARVPGSLGRTFHASD